METILHFLSELRKNNNREWFSDHKSWYEESKQKFLFITEVLINEIRKFDPSLPFTDPKDCMFRIFRDVRFSEDKRPYKTNFGSFMAPGGRKSSYAGYYIHIEPGESFAGGGLYWPPADKLKAVRLHIEQHPEEFRQLINEKGFRKVYPQLYDHQLKTAPKGFAKDHPHIDLLRYQSYAFTHRINDETLAGDKVMDELVKVYQKLYPVNSFLNEALGAEEID